MNSGENPFKAVEETLAAAGVIEPEPEQRTKIKVGNVASELAELVGLALGKQPKLFLRGDTVMKIEYDATLGDLDFVPMKESEFVTWVEKWISFGKWVEKTDEDGNDKKRWVAGSISQKLAKVILDSPQFRDCLPRVVRKNRVRLPILRKNGRCELLPIGFDEESGIYTFPNPVKIDESWDVKRACAYVQDLYSEFCLPLVSMTDETGETVLRQCPRSLGACLGGMMAMFAEGLLPSYALRCGFIYTANSSGSGKSLLAKMAIAPITGQAAGMTFAKDEEVLRTRIDSALLSGQSCLFFDNIKGYIESQVIEALMTLPYWQGRAFHTQRIFSVRNETTLYLSGNNASVSSDINRRFIYVELFLESADPRDRKIRREIDDRWLIDPANRSEILSALWAIVRHWDAVGRPAAPTSIAGFKAWCDVIGGIVSSVTELTGGAIGNPLAQPDLANSGDKETKHLKRLVQLLIEEGLKERQAEAVQAGRDYREVTAERGSHFEFEPHEPLELAMTNGLFDWFLPELTEGQEGKDVIKQAERVRFGQILARRAAEHPKAMKYVIEGASGLEMWRLSYRGSGRHKRYILERE